MWSWNLEPLRLAYHILKFYFKVFKIITKNIAQIISFHGLYFYASNEAETIDENKKSFKTAKNQQSNQTITIQSHKHSFKILPNRG